MPSSVPLTSLLRPHYQANLWSPRAFPNKDLHVIFHPPKPNPSPKERLSFTICKLLVRIPETIDLRPHLSLLLFTFVPFPNPTYHRSLHHHAICQFRGHHQLMFIQIGFPTKPFPYLPSETSMPTQKPPTYHLRFHHHPNCQLRSRHQLMYIQIVSFPT